MASSSNALKKVTLEVSDPESETEAETGKEAESEIEAESGNEADSGTEADDESESGKESESEPGKEAESETAAESEPGTGSEQGDAGAEPENKAVAMASPEAKSDPWEKFGLPPGAREVIDLATGIMYGERFGSFVMNRWPFSAGKGNACNANALALAGLGYLCSYPTPTAKCQVCLRVFRNLESDSDPWLIHAEDNPECPLIRMGPREANGYTMVELIELAYAKVFNLGKEQVTERERIVCRQLIALRQIEIDREAKKKEQKSDEPGPSKPRKR